MSHELRTPLNSSLILAKLLADNPSGNLTDEQVKFAKTIQSSGNDLLTLINDILDLSKIEAGHVEVAPGAGVAGTRWSSGLQPDVPAGGREEGLDVRYRHRARTARTTIVTDPQRLEQILKNLLSNAFKFTEARNGAARGRPAPATAQIALSVVDTGIGIAEEHQRSVFEVVPPGRRHHQPQIRRHRARAFDLERTGAPARRRDPA